MDPALCIIIFAEFTQFSEFAFTGYYGRSHLLTRGQLTGPSLNSLFTHLLLLYMINNNKILSIHRNHNNVSDNGGHSLMITRQMSKKASNVTVPVKAGKLDWVVVLVSSLTHHTRH